MVAPVVMPYVAPYLYREEIADNTAILSNSESVEAIVQIIPKMYKVYLS